MNNSECLEFVNDLETRFPVDEWFVDGVPVWPVLRLRMVLDFLYSIGSVGAPQPKSRARKIKSAWAFAWGNLKIVPYILRDLRHWAWPSRQVDAVFLGDQISRVKVNGVWVDRFCDPLIESLSGRGWRTFHIEPHHHFRIPRRSACLWIQPALSFLRFKAMLRHRTPCLAESHLRGYDEMVARARQRGGAVPFPDLGFEQRLAVIRMYADFFKRILRRLRPRVAFAVSYYGNEGMAFNLACRELGIPTVDIQHGVQGEMHVAYGRWNRVPKQGYSVLPNVFWCWDREEAATIERWSAFQRPFHRPLMGGNPWLEQWKAGRGAEMTAFEAQLDPLARGSKNILVTLQPGCTDEATLIELWTAIRGAPSDWKWWLRLHPNQMGSGERIRIEERLKSTGVALWDVETASRAPLYALLKHMDAHLTHSSSVVLEAQAFGVGSVIIHEFGAEYYTSQLNSGIAIRAETALAIKGALTSLMASRRLAAEGQVDLASEALDQLCAELPEISNAIRRSG